MVIKICKICGKEFDARGRALCCSPECSKINVRESTKKYTQSDKGKTTRKEYCDNHIEEKREYDKKRYENNRDAIRERDKKYYENNRDKILEHSKEYYKNNRDKILERTYSRDQDIISELCDQYDGNLKQILKNVPNLWQVREAQMRVWFGESYYDGIMAKIKSTPVCEVTGEKDNLVIHHLYSFNTHPELGNDVANMVRITKTIHNEFHNIYGKGDNTPEQWIEFIIKRGEFICI